MKKLKLIKVTNENLEVKEVENTLEALQNEVEGYIEIIPFDEEFCLIVNEEGRIKNLDYSMTLINGCQICELFGNVLICKTTKNGNFKSLTKDEIEYFTIFNRYFVLLRTLKI